MSTRSSDRSFFVFNAVVSVVALGALAWLLLFHRVERGSTELDFMPALNACLNATSALFLIAGRLAIARGNASLHRALMVSAFAASAVFLVGYVTYHSVHGDTRFGGEGVIRPIYFALLISHVVLSMTVVPGCLAAFYFAFKQQFDRHTRVTRWLHPVWLYVSVTGVLVFFLLRPYYASAPPGL